MRLSPRLHMLLLAAVVAALGACFLQEPVLGDDLTYWNFAYNLHALGLTAWPRLDFYSLRWPVWGVCWLLQALCGPGLASYWGVALIYLGAGAALSFFFARRLTSSVLAGWSCGLVFLFHPFLDAVAYCPMPDLSESVWGAAAMIAWWKLMMAEEPRRRWIFAAVLGLLVVVLEANRLTGVFLIPVLVVCTALFFRRRFGWLIGAGCFALILYAAECALYRHLFGNWLHDLNANALNKGAKGTELLQPWLLPFRFLDSFWNGAFTRAYSVFALIGSVFAWRKGGRLGRVLVIWTFGLLLEYSCALQSLSPIRPLVRDAARFLSALAVPMSVLALLGVWRLVALVRQKFPGTRFAAAQAGLPIAMSTWLLAAV
ncbi:MAG: hypothetical protein M3Y86_10815, partial [Verrucomicrobiota bacterium]|nr:hypothetical protein [Verrucomicrobiota bacterium]